MKKLLSIVLLVFSCVAMANIALKPNAPNYYRVKPGDTLWDIANKYLQKPWQWQKIWRANPKLGSNPHKIYPGDMLVLDHSQNQPHLIIRSNGVVKLSPTIYKSSIDNAIPTIPLNAIKPFLDGSRILTRDGLDHSPKILAPVGEHLIAGAGSNIYADAIKPNKSHEAYTIFRKGETYIEPKSKIVLGYSALKVGEARLIKPGHPAMLLVTKAKQEVKIGDRLLPTHKGPINIHFTPQVPRYHVMGQIIALLSDLTQITQFQNVVINLGVEDEIQAGDVLAVYRKGKLIKNIRDKTHNSYYTQLPEQQVGTLMIFRAFRHLSYALVLHSTKAIHLMDRVTNPT